MRPELTGFAPDLDPQSEGILTDCDAIVPTTQGLAAANSPIPTQLPALATVPTAGYVADLLDGTRRMFAASATRIYEATSATAWTDRSRTGNYTGTNRQRFCVFGNNTLACNRSQMIGQAVSGSGFVDIANSPAALVIFPVSGFVMALNVSSVASGDIADGWYCSGLRDQTSWDTTNPAT